MTFYGCGREGRFGSCRPIYDASLSLSPGGDLDFDEQCAGTPCAAPAR